MLVMSFNLRYGTADDGANSWPHRRSAALEVLRSSHADFFGMQEVLDFQIEEILAALPGYGYIGVGRDDGDRLGEFCPIFYDSSKWECLESGTTWFSDSPTVPGSRHSDCFHPRICTWADFGGSHRFIVYNVHLDNESASSRSKSVHQLIEMLASRRLPTIVTGDFNAGESEPCIEAMRSAGFRDSFRILHADAPAPTFHGFGRADYDEKIDYIWIDRRWAVRDAAVLTQQVDGKWPSDHYPIVASLALPD